MFDRNVLRYGNLIGIVCMTLLLVLLVSAIAANILVFGIRSYAIASDFRPFYMAGLMILHGVRTNLYAYQTQFFWQNRIVHLASLQHLMPFRNPPATALLFAAFALFSYTLAYILWQIVNGLLLVGIIYGTYRLLPQKTISSFIFFILAIITFAPIIITLVQAQVSYLLVIAFLFARLFLLKNKPFWAGMALVLLFVKPQYIVLPLFFLLWKRQGLAVLGYVIGLGILIFLSFMLVGVPGLIQYVTSINNTMSGHEQYMLHNAMPTLQGFLLSSFGTTALPRIQIPWIVSVIIIMGIGIFACRKYVRPNDAWFDVQWAILLIVTTLTSVFTNFQDLSILLVAGICLVRWRQQDAHRGTIKSISLLVAGGYIVCLLSSFVWTVYHVQIFVPYLCLVLFFLTWRTIKQTATQKIS